MSNKNAVKIEKFYEMEIWVESDILGAKHVMVEHTHPTQSAFCYCTFNYHHGYTSNAEIARRAIDMAVSLGAKEPVDIKSRTLDETLSNMLEADEKDSLERISLSLVVKSWLRKHFLRRKGDEQA
tara:strand:+ start:10675 stop:11049 length:375 start_codon:yes stop_codon:yes gene_type:complete